MPSPQRQLKIHFSLISVRSVRDRLLFLVTRQPTRPPSQSAPSPFLFYKSKTLPYGRPCRSRPGRYSPPARRPPATGPNSTARGRNTRAAPGIARLPAAILPVMDELRAARPQGRPHGRQQASRITPVKGLHLPHPFPDHTAHIAPPAAMQVGHGPMLRIVENNRLAIGLLDQQSLPGQVGQQDVPGFCFRRPRRIPFLSHWR